MTHFSPKMYDSGLNSYFSLENDQFQWDNLDLDRIRPQIDLEIDNKNRFPVWAKLRQNVRFSDNLT